MFINIATENIIVYDPDRRHGIPFHDVETILSDVCITSYKQYLPDTVYVLNGPGSFTNLRVGSLVVNTLLLVAQQVNIMTIDKLSLYRAVVASGFLPRYGYIFMGQRKNIWYYDFVEDTYVILSKSEIDTHLQGNLHASQNHSFFVDVFVGADFAEFFQGHKMMVDITYTDGNILIAWLGKEYLVTDLFSATKKMEPYYAMEPNIG